MEFEFIVKKNVLQDTKRKKNWGVGYPHVGRHVVNEPKLGCHDVDELEIS